MIIKKVCDNCNKKTEHKILEDNNNLVLVCNVCENFKIIKVIKVGKERNTIY